MFPQRKVCICGVDVAVAASAGAVDGFGMLVAIVGAVAVDQSVIADLINVAPVLFNGRHTFFRYTPEISSFLSCLTSITTFHVCTLPVKS